MKENRDNEAAIIVHCSHVWQLAYIWWRISVMRVFVKQFCNFVLGCVRLIWSVYQNMYKPEGRSRFQYSIHY